MNTKCNLLFAVMVLTPAVAFAQLKVKSDGSVIAGTDMLSNSVLKYSFQSGRSVSTNYCNVAVYGETNNLTNAGSAYGVYGLASNGGTGFNFGVVGTKGSSSQGAGISGFTYPMVNTGIIGNYAGYFSGPTLVHGTLTAYSVVQTSDLRLKENIIPLSSRQESALDKVLNMNVIEFSYKNKFPSLVLPDSVSIEEAMKRMGITPGKKHIGLIAQELRELYPSLVEEGQDGYLTVNYIELVPVLIRSIQELKQELDEVKGASKTMTRSASKESTNISASTAGYVLYQNAPNPFKEQTVIRFKLEDDVQDASICIFDMTGKTLKKLPISSGMESVSVGGYELGEGMFLYSLIVNGQVVDTKRMIII